MDRLPERGHDPQRGRTGYGRSRASGRAAGADRAAAVVAAGGNRGAGSGGQRDRGSDGAADLAVDRVNLQVEALDELTRSARVGGETGWRRVSLNDRLTQLELRYALGRSLLALAPPQVQRLQQLLTRPQRALLTSALREMRALLVDQDRER
jgi:hypothetical protein